IVTSSGYYLYPQITVPENSSALTVSKDGKVSVILQGEDTSTEIGQIELVRFINPAGLRALGGNLYASSEASGEPIISIPGEEGTGTIVNGYLEASNVRVVDEMVAMITAQRAFEIISKAIQVGEEMMQVVNSIKR
ncbi:MAG: flagellar hook-basal body complex protein, partial [Chitinispirillaceae bacterium]|nr:flagellar hook-basal body complex protein [Chitinispirillaceae bacterium]